MLAMKEYEDVRYFNNYSEAIIQDFFEEKTES